MNTLFIRRSAGSAVCLAAACAFFFFNSQEKSPLAAVPPLADFNADGCVDGKDLILLGLHYNCCKAKTDCLTVRGCEATACVDDPCYNAARDIGPLDSKTLLPAPDGKIDSNDLQVLLGEYAVGCP